MFQIVSYPIPLILSLFQFFSPSSVVFASNVYISPFVILFPLVCFCCQFPVSIIGYFLFASTITMTQAEFIVVNIVGGFIYSAAKIKVSTCQRISCYSSSIFCCTWNICARVLITWYLIIARSLRCYCWRPRPLHIDRYTSTVTPRPFNRDSCTRAVTATVTHGPLHREC